MKPANPSPASEPARRSSPLLLAVVFFVLGAVAAGTWLCHHEASSGAGGLSASTQTVLGQLQVPVIIHYYSLLPADSADAALQAFAARVANLLDAMQTAGGGKIEITTIDNPAGTNTTAATADGIQPFNLDKGTACFLGLTIVSGKNKEVLPHLQAEWEPALQYDLARAIERTAAVPPPPQPAPEIAKPSPEIISSIQRLVPDVNATSIDDANRIFHEDYLKQCAAAGQELETQISAASAQVVQAQNNGSAADLEKARNHLLQIQLSQGEKLKEIAAHLQIEMAVFQQMKNANTNSAK